MEYIIMIVAAVAIVLTAFVTTKIANGKSGAKISALEKENEILERQLCESKEQEEARKAEVKADFLRQLNEKDAAYRQMMAEQDGSYRKQMELFRDQLKNDTQEILQKRQDELTKTGSSAMDAIVKPLNERLKEMREALDKHDYKNLATNYYSKDYRAESQEKYRWIEYHKWKLKFRNYTALAKSQKHTPVLMTRAEIGILGHYNKYKKSPFESYYMGGDGMSGYSTGYATETIGLRGYENGSLAGANYDNAYAYTRFTLELRVPIMLQTSTSIYALTFAEAGNAWQDVSKMNPFSLKKSAGFGVRILLPMVGLMGIDWAYGFQKYNAAGTKIGGSQFHFIIGQEF